MKRVGSVIANCILGVGLMLSGCTSSGITHDKTFARTVGKDSVDYHLTALQQHQDIATVLEQKIQKLQDRIKAYNQKPYRDPKGFRRGGWKRLVGKWEQDVQNLREQMVWHENEITRLRASAKEPGLTGGQETGNS